MRNKILFYIILILLPAIISCNSKTYKPDETLSELIDADNAGNLEKVISLYTTDAMLIPAGKSNIIGIDSIRKNYQNIFSNSKLDLLAEIHENEIIESGNYAVIYGIIFGKVINLNDKSVAPVNDKFIMVLKNIGRKWKVYRLMWSKQ